MRKIVLSKIKLNFFTVYTMNDSSKVDLRDLRKPYSTRSEALLESSLDTRDPLKLFHNWFETVKTCDQVLEPNAVCLATSHINGCPSSRMVLLKGYGREGFTFFTNYNSRKAQELTDNPNASLLFFWAALKRQVRIEGTVEKVSEEESVEYFSQRPRASQLSARISQQSDVIESRDVLTDRYNEEELKFSKEVPKPDFWGGFRVVPKVFEFWSGQTDRLHDRIVFFRLNSNEEVDGKLIKMGDEGWAYKRLQP